MIQRRFLRASEVAQHLGLSVSKVRLMVQNGELPAARFGRSVRIETDALETFLRRGTSDGSGQPPASSPESE